MQCNISFASKKNIHQESSEEVLGFEPLSAVSTACYFIRKASSPKKLHHQRVFAVRRLQIRNYVVIHVFLQIPSSHRESS